MNLILIKDFLISVFLVLFNGVSPDPNPPRVYPVPPENENSLFYLQRTKNVNAIVYEVNRSADGKVNQDDPVKIYWIRYTSDSTKADLTAIQRKYAYGMSARPYNGAKNSFVLQFAAYKKRNMFLLPSNNENHYGAYININGKLSELKKVFIATSGGSFWFPKVDYIELTGKDPTTHQMILERFVP